jgi:hypothetical protein
MRTARRFNRGFGRTQTQLESKDFRAGESSVALRLPPQSKTRWREF